jgi:hypothetical protein
MGRGSAGVRQGGAEDEMLTRVERRVAKRELRELLPRAQRKAAQDPGNEIEWKAGSPVGELAGPYLRIENVTGVHIYALFGGWYSDLLFDAAKMPRASTTAIGTPMHTPHKTRDEAEENAVNLLSMVIANSRKPQQPAEDSGKRHFSWFGLWLEFPVNVGRSHLHS